MSDYSIGTKVERIEIVRGQPLWNHGQRGEIVEMTDDRIRVLWQDHGGVPGRRTWLARSALGQRWCIAGEKAGA